MFAESETELRDLIVQNLESSGFLNKIKAELRAGVFLALAEEGSLRKKIPLFHKKLDDFINTDDGKLVLSVIREFLEYFNLNFTLSVFDPEIASTTPCIARADLCEKLNLNESEFDGPVLSALLKQQPPSKAQDSFSDKNKQLETISEDVTLRNKNVFSGDLMKESAAQYFPEKLSTKLDKEVFEDHVEKAPDDTIKSNESTRNASQSSNKTSIDKIPFDFSKSEQKGVLKDHSTNLDPFFDEPIPSESPGFLNLSSGNEQNKLSSNFLYSDKGYLSSLKDLPSLTKQDGIFSKESSSLTLKPVSLESNADNLDTVKKEDFIRKDLDPESNEESSDRQLNSEESIEEEIEEDFSAGLDDLLNSSLSLGEDVTSDQTISQTSVVEGVDHIEPCDSVN